MNHNKNQGMQYAQNVLPNVLSDVMQNPHYISDNVHRKDVGWDRNDWAERMVRSIRF